MLHAPENRQNRWFSGLFRHPPGITLLRRNSPRLLEIRMNGAFLAIQLAAIDAQAVLEAESKSGVE